MGAGRLEQINMFGPPTSRSTTADDNASRTLRPQPLSVSYVLANSRGVGRPADRVVQRQRRRDRARDPVRDEEWGPTRLDERHRLVASGVVELPGGLPGRADRPVGSPAPYSLNAGFDIDGDGLITVDRLCEGVDPAAVFAVRGNVRRSGPSIRSAAGAQQVNTQRGGFVVNPDGSIEERSGRYFNVDLRVTKTFA